MKLNFMKYRFHFYAFSISLALLALVLVGVKGLVYGIDFQGGNVLRIRFDAPADGKELNENFIRKIFENMEGKVEGLYFKPDQVVIQSVGGEKSREFMIQYPAAAADTSELSHVNGEILKKIKEAASYSDDAIETSNVGPTVGNEMKRQAVWAAIIATLGILLYLAWRFEFQSASGAVIALVHDCIITLGFVCIMRIEFDVTVLAAFMTLLGYSVNDSIVVLDRIRENRRIMRETSFSALIDDSIISTLGRTINTSLTTLFSLVALYLIGGDSLRGFSATMIFGIIIGTYSSVFVASSLLLELTGEKLDRRRR